jgi:phenylalanyl-tRNA synthetase beta chain
MKPYPVEITYSRINSLIGKEITKDEVKTILKGLEIEIKSETKRVSLWMFQLIVWMY